MTTILDNEFVAGLYRRGTNKNTMTTNLVISAYCICKICCGKDSIGLAANGKPPIAGITCAAPRFIPLGTQLTIEGVGKRIVTDRTIRQYDGRIDLFMSSHKEALKWGIKEKQVVIQQTKPKH